MDVFRLPSSTSRQLQVTGSIHRHVSYVYVRGWWADNLRRELYYVCALSVLLQVFAQRTLATFVCCVYKFYLCYAEQIHTTATGSSNELPYLCTLYRASYVGRAGMYSTFEINGTTLHKLCL